MYQIQPHLFLRNPWYLGRGVTDCVSTEWSVTALGLEITDQISNGTKSWPDLWSKSEFFSSYNIYVAVTGWADSEKGINSWEGLVDSTIRIFVGNLESLVS